MKIEERFTKEARKFGIRVKELRKEVDLNQAELGRSIGLTQPQISNIEKGTSNFEFVTLVKLANGFNVSLAVLFDYDNTQHFRKLTKQQDIKLRLKSEKQKLGNRLLELIEYRATKQDDLAVISDIDAGDLSRFINGEHNIELFNIVKIAEGLKIELIELFYYKGGLPKSKDFKGLVKTKGN